MKRFIFAILLCFSLFCKGQEATLDTLPIMKMLSNIPITGKLEHLTFSFKNLKQFHYNFNIRAMRITANEERLIYVVNAISAYDSKLQYYEKDGNIRLSYIDFKYYNNVKIIFEDLTLSRQLTLYELMNKFHYTDTNIAGPQVGIVAPYKTTKKDRFYAVDFVTGESDSTKIELYFDRKKLLRWMCITFFMP
jgi:hypothetical protein